MHTIWVQFYTRSHIAISLLVLLCDHLQVDCTRMNCTLCDKQDSISVCTRKKLKGVDHSPHYLFTHTALKQPAQLQSTVRRASHNVLLVHSPHKTQHSQLIAHHLPHTSRHWWTPPSRSCYRPCSPLCSRSPQLPPLPPLPPPPTHPHCLHHPHSTTPSLLLVSCSARVAATHARNSAATSITGAACIAGVRADTRFASARYTRHSPTSASSMWWCECACSVATSSCAGASAARSSPSSSALCTSSRYSISWAGDCRTRRWRGRER